MKSFTNFLTTPGSSLTGREKTSFDEIKAIIERSTNDMLMRPDWDANMQCVDLVNGESNASVLAEIVIVLKRKLQSRTPKVVSLTLSLAETMVKNGTIRVHAALGADTFMKEMAKTARKYNAKTGADNREVAELALDIIQAWGEAFLPRQKQFPNYVKYYHDLRKEGLAFNRQFDSSRVPIFTPPSTVTGSGAGGTQIDEDAILAAALAASFSDISYEDGGNGSNAAVGVASASAARPRGSGAAPSSSGAPSGSSGGSLWETSDVIDLGMSVVLLKEMIEASSSSAELRDNEIAADIAHQLRELQSRMAEVIEHAVTHNPESIDKLFKLNEDVQQVMAVYDDFLRGRVAADTARSALMGVGTSLGSEPAPTKPKQQQDVNILDFDDIGSPNVHPGFGVSPMSSPAPPPVSASMSFADPFEVGSGASKHGGTGSLDVLQETHGMHSSVGGEKSPEPARRASRGAAFLPPPRAPTSGTARPRGTSTSTSSSGAAISTPGKAEADLLGDVFSAPVPAPAVADPFGAPSGDIFGAPTADRFAGLTSSAPPATVAPAAPSPAPAALIAQDPFGPSSTLSGGSDPFGNSSSIDALLVPTSTVAAAAPKLSNASVMDLFNAPPAPPSRPYMQPHPSMDPFATAGPAMSLGMSMPPAVSGELYPSHGIQNLPMYPAPAPPATPLTFGAGPSGWPGAESMAPVAYGTPSAGYSAGTAGAPQHPTSSAPLQRESTNPFDF